MTEDSGSHEHHGRERHGERSGVRWTTIGGWVVAGLLAAYLGYGMVRQVDGRPQAPFSEDTLFAGLFWGAVAVVLAASACGILWTARTYARREKASLLWMRHAFTFGAIAAVLLAAVPRDPKTGRWFIAWVAAALIAGQSGLFAYAAWREHQRVAGGGRRSRHSDAGEDDR